MSLNHQAIAKDTAHSVIQWQWFKSIISFYNWPLKNMGFRSTDTPYSQKTLYNIQSVEGPNPNRTCDLIRRDTKSAPVQSKGHARIQWEDGYRQAREISLETNPANIVILDLQPPEL